MRLRRRHVSRRWVDAAGKRVGVDLDDPEEEVVGLDKLVEALLGEARLIFEGRASFGDGRGTASEHYMRFARAGVPGFKLDAPEVRNEAAAGELDHLLAWYSDIRGRAPRGMHFEPVLLSEIQAYEHFLGKLGIKMSAFEWDMIFRLDAVWQDCVPSPDGKPKPRKQTAH